MATIRRPDGRLGLVAGASRSGKTYWTREQVAGAGRLLVWDLLGEWGGDPRFRCQRAHSLTALRDWVKRGDSPGRMAYFRPGMAGDFSAFCALAWLWVQVGAGAVVVEETASVTGPGKAPAAWGDLCRAGLRYGPDIYALTQRPAESDKTSLGNASLVHCHRVTTPRDRAYIAGLLGVPVADVAALATREWIERDAFGQVRRSRASSMRKKAP